MKIALIGTAPSSIRLAPYGSKDWVFWGCSPGAYGVVPNPSAWFEIHRYEPGQPWFSEGYCKFLENFDGPVYMAEPTPRVKNCVPLPVEELVSKYGPYFFNSTLSWMFALAIESNPETIGLWGVDMAAQEEYYSQKMGCIWFAQIAQSLGIEVGVPPESDLFVPPPLYGVCETNHAFIKFTARQRELQTRLTDAEQRLRVAQEESTFLKGALDDLGWSQQTWTGNMKERGKEFTSPAHAPVLKVLTDQMPSIPENQKVTKIKSNGKGTPDVSVDAG